MSEWKEVRLGDIATFRTGKLNSNAAVENGKYPFFTCSPETLKINDYAFDQEAILLAGNNAEGNFSIKYYCGKFNAYQRTYVISGNESIDNKYLYYALSLCLKQFKSYSQGTATKFLTAVILNNFHISIPTSIVTQRRIASILSSLDDKIAVNRRICENLEAQAQALFKHWFIDFAPFKDGKFVESELGMIPEGWRVGTLGDICSYSDRKVAISSLDNKSYYSTENMLPNKAGAVESSSLPQCEMTTGCYPFDVLISNIRPYFKKIIRVAAPCGCSADVLCFHPHDSKYKSFLYMALYDDSFFSYVMAGSKGTKMPRGDKKQIMKYPLAIPTDYILEDFSNIVEPMFESISILKAESSRLSLLRDTLLPKLMSGEIKL